MQLKEKAVFVTGAVSGIGKAIVEAVLKEGAKAVIADINEKAGEELAASLQDKYGKDYVIFIKCDVTDETSFTGAFKDAVEKFGYIDVMINNAGIVNETYWKKMVDVNFAGVVTGTQLAVGHMRKDNDGNGGIIINISSVGGFMPWTYAPVYIGTKHAVVGYTRSLAEAPDGHKTGIRFGVVCPDITDTPLCNFSNETVHHYDHLVTLMTGIQLLPPSRTAEGVLKLIADDNSNGALLPVTKDELIYKTPVMEIGIKNQYIGEFKKKR